MARGCSVRLSEKSEELAIFSAEHRLRPVCNSVTHLAEPRKALALRRFIYEKAAERLLRHFTGWDENKVIRQARVWCEENS